jgi:hypothetical protein
MNKAANPVARIFEERQMVLPLLEERAGVRTVV